MGGFWRRYSRRWASVLGLALLALVVAGAAAAPLVFPADPWDMAGAPYLWPGQETGFPLGTDTLGRDVAAGLFHGARVSLLVGIAATAAALGVGILVGAVAGYYGGIVDDALMRLTEIFQTIPNFIFIIVLVVIFKPSIATIVLSISAVSWPALARLVRAEFLSLRRREFVQSCILVGMGDARVILTEILPNCLAPVIVTASIMVATAILIEAGLSFLGLGDPNVISWGSMIGAGRTSLRNAWYLTAIPGLAIVVTVLALNLVGEGLNDAFNPRLRPRAATR
ncbi:MAG: ABC transporter permease [Alphaproteobacteria bacterium]|nr:ABC transporter permease [Alphaproteobacteria bacterium]